MAGRALNYPVRWGAAGSESSPLVWVGAAGMCRRAFLWVVRSEVGWFGRSSGWQGPRGGARAPGAPGLRGDLPSAGGAGETGGAQLTQVDPAGAEFEPGIVLGDTAVPESAGGAGEPGDAPFHHRSVFLIVGSHLRVGGPAGPVRALGRGRGRLTVTVRPAAAVVQRSRKGQAAQAIPNFAVTCRRRT